MKSESLNETKYREREQQRGGRYRKTLRKIGKKKRHPGDGQSLERGGVREKGKES